MLLAYFLLVTFRTAARFPGITISFSDPAFLGMRRLIDGRKHGCTAGSKKREKKVPKLIGDILKVIVEKYEEFLWTREEAWAFRGNQVEFGF